MTLGRIFGKISRIFTCFYVLMNFQLLKVPRLEMIETVDSVKLADELNKKWSSISPNDPLKILVQVNTSQEEGTEPSIDALTHLAVNLLNVSFLSSVNVAKSGIAPNAVTDVYRHIVENCKNLSPHGLMTIGQFGHDYSSGPNPDFLSLLDCHKNVCNAFNLTPDKVHISMGMSDDFEQAVS